MPEQYVEVTKRGLGNRLIGSIKGIIVGFVLFVGSFGLLYWNEGRVDLSLIAKKAAEISATSPNPDSSLNGKLVSVTGTLSSTETLGDSLFLNPGNYLAVRRAVEMYAWVEDQKSETKKELGGSETTTTTYTYRKDWTRNPRSSGQFKIPEGHTNPGKTYDDYSGTVSTAKLGIYDVDPKGIGLPGSSDISLTEQNVTLSQGARLADGRYILLGSGAVSAPQVGDLRISYSALASGVDGTAFGKLDGTRISPYVDADDNRLYRFLRGGRGEAIASLKKEHKIMTWLLRLGGFIMMWIGLSSLFAPISTFLDIVPIFGELSRGLIGIVTFVVSLVLSVVTMIVSAILHSLVAVLIAAVLVLALGIVVLKMKRKKIAAAAAAG